MSKIKLIAVDMDGTLLNSKKQLPQEFYSVYEEVKKQNIVFVVASGRQYANIKNQFNPEIQEDIYYVAENGSNIIYKKQDLLVNALKKEDVKRVIEIARTIPGADPIACGRKRAYIESESPELMKNVAMYYDERAVVSDLTAIEDDDILKIAICDLNGSEANSYPYFKHLQGELQVKVSGEIWVDLSDRLANKGVAIEWLQNHLNISRLNTAAFGDYMNDIEMLEAVEWSYAMDNAHPAVKAVAKYNAGSNDEAGVLSVIRKLLAV